MNLHSSKREINSHGRTLPDVVLHIGAPKSGSSAIQRFCMSHRQELLKKGYYYPEHDLDVNNISAGHTQVAGALLNGSESLAKSNFQGFLAKAKRKKACLLLSSEAFYGQYQSFKNIAKDLNVKVVGFLRHPVESMLSNHNQGAKRHLSTWRLNEMIHKVIADNANGYLAGLPLLGWADAFGDANCCFMAYQPPGSGGKLIEPQFLRILNWPEAEVGALTKDVRGITNRSYVQSALELKRILNTVLASLPKYMDQKIDWCLQGFSDHALNERGYHVHDLPAEVRSLLEENLLSQMQPVIERFPQLQEAAELPAVGLKDPHPKVIDLQAPLETLRNEVPEVLDSIYQQALAQRDTGRKDYAFCKLLDLLGIDFNEPKASEQSFGLSAHQRKVLTGKQIELADSLREMAVLLERQGFMEDAHLAISLALAKRPDGLGIQQIKARIERELETRSALRGSPLG